MEKQSVSICIEDTSEILIFNLSMKSSLIQFKKKHFLPTRTRIHRSRIRDRAKSLKPLTYSMVSMIMLQQRVCTGLPQRSECWDKIVSEKCIAEKIRPFALRLRCLSRNVDHVNNIPALCPLCSRLRCYRGCISSLQPRCYVEGGFSAAVISLPLNNTQRGAARRRIARACGIIQCRVKRLICCAMAVTHLTITATKKPQVGTMVGVDERWGGGRIDARKYDTPDIPRTLRYTFLVPARYYCCVIDLFLRFLYADHYVSIKIF